MKKDDYKTFFLEDNPSFVDYNRFVDSQSKEFNFFVKDNKNETYKIGTYEVFVIYGKDVPYHCHFVFDGEQLISVVIKLNDIVIKYFGNTNKTLIDHFGKLVYYDHNLNDEITAMTDFYFLFDYDESIRFERFQEQIWSVYNGLYKYLLNNIPLEFMVGEISRGVIKYENGKSLEFNIDGDHIVSIVFRGKDGEIEKEINDR